MDVRQLKYFVAVAELGNFTRAAERCHVAQPSLSQQIAALEDELGDKLFHRKPREVTLTPAGQELLLRAQGLVENFSEIEHWFAKHKEEPSGVLRIGVIPTVAPYFLPPVLESFRKKYNEVRLEITEAQTHELTHAVAADDLDVAVVSDLNSADEAGFSLHVSLLYMEPLLLGVSTKHKLADLNEIDVRDIPVKQVVHLRMGHCLREQSVQICPKVSEAHTIECEQLSTLATLVEHDLGIAIFPANCREYLSGNSLHFIDLVPERNRTVNLITKRGTSPTALGYAFQRHLKEIYRKTS